MNDGIEIEGMEEYTDMLQGMTIDEADEKKALKKAIKPISNEIRDNTTKKSGKLAKISETTKKEGFAVVGTVKTKEFYDIFEEFGTSKAKHNVGYFERSVKNKEDEALSILAKELLDKIK